MRSSSRSQRSIGTPKPCFGRSTTAAGRRSRDRPLQEVLRREPAELQIGRQAGAELHELVVEEGRAALEPVRHGRDVDLHEQVVGEIRLAVDLERGVHQVGALGAAEGRRQVLDRVAIPGRAAELLGRELALERRVEVAHPARVAAGGRLAQRLDEATGPGHRPAPRPRAARRGAPRAAGGRDGPGSRSARRAGWPGSACSPRGSRLLRRRSGRRSRGAA